MIKIKTFEEFQNAIRNGVNYQKDIADGFLSHDNKYCEWQIVYKSYVYNTKKYIEKMQPVYEFLKSNPNKRFCVREIQQHFNYINNGAMTSLLGYGLVNRYVVKEISANGTPIPYYVYGWPTEVES